MLARRPGEPGEPQAVTLIETRGTGGQVVVAPTPPGIHPEHPERGYELVRGSWEDLQVITPEERQALFELARSFNSYVANVKSPIPTGAGQPRANSERPGDLLNSTADREWWRALLEPRGWTLVHQQGDIDYWRRPGKEDKSWSATLGACGPLFYVFSSNAVPFEADRGYQPFTAYALLEHGGDFKAAAMAIAPPRQRANSHTRAATDTAAGRAPTAPPLQPDQSPTSCADDDYPYGDAYNALALVRAHRQDLRYCAAWKSWLTWIGTHWERDTTGRVMRWQRQTVQALGAALPDMDKDDAKALLTHIKSSLNTSRLKAAIEQAPSWEGISNSRRSINPSKHAILLPGFS